MKLLKVFLTAVLVMILFSACWDSIVDDDEDEKKPKTDPEKSEKLTASADSVVSEMIKGMVSGGDANDLAGYLSTASDYYKEAASADPSNSHANFGAGLFTFQNILNNPDINMIQDKLEEWSKNMDELDHSRYYITRYFLYGQTGFEISEQHGENKWTEYINIDPGSAVMALMYFVQNSLSEPDLIALIQNMIDTEIITALDETISYMNNVLADNDFTYMLTPEMTGEDDAMEMDLGEAYMITAVIHVLRANLKIINAYQLSVPGANNMGDYSDEATFLNLIKIQDEQGGDFLKLRSMTTLPSAQEDLLDALTLVEQGVAFILQETDDQLNDLIKREDITEADQDIQSSSGVEDNFIPLLQNITGITDITASIKEMLSGPFDIGEGEGTVTIDLSAFLNNGMTDLKDFLPLHKWADLSTISTIFRGTVISPSGRFDNNGIEYQGYWVDLFWMYRDMTQDETIVDFEMYGTFSEDGVFTILATNNDFGFSLMEAGVNLTGSGDFYLDDQKRFCMTEEAYKTLNDYVKNAPRDSNLALWLFEATSEHIKRNFSPDHPFGIRGGDGVFKFAGRLEYDKSQELLYLVDEQGERAMSPVFPDYTFGGLFPAMTQDMFVFKASIE